MTRSLDAARRVLVAVPHAPLTETYENLGLDDAEAIQTAQVGRGGRIQTAK
jgi:hypothetical protein